MKAQASSKRRAPSSSLPLSSLVYLCIAGALFAALPLGVFAIPDRATSIAPEGFVAVVMAPLRLVIPQEGELAARQNATIVSKCDWQTRVMWLIPEGTWVEPGEVICRLDTSELRENILERELLLVKAEAQFATAQEDVRIQTLLNQSNTAKAGLDAQLADLDYLAYQEAEYPRQLHVQQSAVALAEESLLRATKLDEYTGNMVRLGYRNADDLEKQRIATLKAQQEYDNAVEKLRVLEDFTRDRELCRLQGAAESTTAHKGRVDAIATTALLNREVRLRTYERSVALHRSMLERMKTSLEACTIVAPQAGEVQYVSDEDGSDKIEEGNSAYLMRPLLRIPDRREMNVSLRVHESQIRHIQVGQAATVEVNALAGKKYPARVTSVSTIPMIGRWPYYDLREYRVVVSLQGQFEEVRELAPGLTAKVEIDAAFKPSVLQVPVESVVEMGSKYFVFVREGDDVVEREVELGLSNNRVLEVVSGLETGEQVVLQPRQSCGNLLTYLRGRHTSTVWDESL